MAETIKTAKTASKPKKAAAEKVVAEKPAAKKPVAKKAAVKTGIAAGIAAETAPAIAIVKPVLQEDVAALAHRFWAERGYQHGHHIADWFRAEQELRGKAS